MGRRVNVGYFLFATTGLLGQGSGCPETGVRGVRYARVGDICMYRKANTKYPPWLSGLLTWDKYLHSSAIRVLLCLHADN